jgi:hypothetical protein
MENELEIQPDKFRTLLAGTKTYSIRRGHRAFDKSIRVSNTANRVVVSGIVNSYVHTLLAEVPFRVFESEGWKSFQESLDALRVYYSELDWNSEVTIVEFRLAL